MDGSAQKRTDNRLEELLATLERKAAGAPAGQAAAVFHHTREACQRGGDTPRALGYYGRAIDAYLSASHFNAAAAVCRKLLKIAPAAVRTHCTLAWLAVGRGVASEVDSALRGYVTAARNAGQESVAIRQMLRMARAAADGRLRQVIGRHLEAIGAAEAARAAATTDPGDAVAPALLDRETRWAAVMHGALADGLD
jgi:hypothetical protein